MKNLLFVFLLSLAIIIVGCKKGDTGPQGPAGPVLEGSIAGHVLMFDSYGSQMMTELAGIKVYIEGKTDTVTTDSTGAYSFSNLTSGNYTVVATDTGCGTVKTLNIQFIGGLSPRDLRISKLPNFDLNSITAIDTLGQIQVTATVNADAKARTALFFVGKQSNTSSHPDSYLTFYARTINANATSFKFTIQTSDMLNLGFNAGDAIYIAGYAASTNYNNTSSYEDLATARTVYNAISPYYLPASTLIP